ncbi:hypothetical protein V8F33_013028 [Rhypophila sp. PSN 637]
MPPKATGKRPRGRPRGSGRGGGQAGSRASRSTAEPTTTSRENRGGRGGGGQGSGPPDRSGSAQSSDEPDADEPDVDEPDADELDQSDSGSGSESEEYDSEASAQRSAEEARQKKKGKKKTTGEKEKMIKFERIGRRTVAEVQDSNQERKEAALFGYDSEHWSNADEEDLQMKWKADRIRRSLLKLKNTEIKEVGALWRNVVQYYQCLPTDIVGPDTRLGYWDIRGKKGEVGSSGTPAWSSVFSKALGHILFHPLWDNGDRKSLVIALQFAVIVRTDDRRPWEFEDVTDIEDFRKSKKKPDSILRDSFEEKPYLLGVEDLALIEKALCDLGVYGTRTLATPEANRSGVVHLTRGTNKGLHPKEREREAAAARPPSVGTSPPRSSRSSRPGSRQDRGEEIFDHDLVEEDFQNGSSDEGDGGGGGGSGGGLSDLGGGGGGDDWSDDNGGGGGGGHDVDTTMADDQALSPRDVEGGDVKDVTMTAVVQRNSSVEAEGPTSIGGSEGASSRHGQDQIITSGSGGKRRASDAEIADSVGEQEEERPGRSPSLPTFPADLAQMRSHEGDMTQPGPSAGKLGSASRNTPSPYPLPIV